MASARRRGLQVPRVGCARERRARDGEGADRDVLALVQAALRREGMDVSLSSLCEFVNTDRFVSTPTFLIERLQEFGLRREGLRLCEAAARGLRDSSIDPETTL